MNNLIIDASTLVTLLLIAILISIGTLITILVIINRTLSRMAPPRNRQPNRNTNPTASPDSPLNPGQIRKELHALEIEQLLDAIEKALQR